MPPALELTFLPVVASTILDSGVGSFSAVIFLATVAATVACVAALPCSLATFFSALAAPLSASARSRRPMRALSPLGFLEHEKKAWPKLPVEAAAGHEEAT